MSSELETLTGGSVVKFACDTFRDEGIPVARAHLAILGRHAKALLEDGFEYHTVCVAGVIALRRGSPQLLQYIASDLVMARGGKRMTRREYEKALEDEMELGR